MKKIVPFVVFLASLALAGCQKELNGPGNPTANNTGCKDCAFIPMCDGSVYTYIDSLPTGPRELTDTIRILKDTSMLGLPFKEIRQSGGTGQRTFFNCNNGTTTSIATGVFISNPALPGGGITLPSVKSVFLKANEPVGGQWSDTTTYSYDVFGVTVTINAFYKYTITAKGATRTVLGRTYNDVIEVKNELSTQNSLLPIVLPVGTFNYYYAKNVGLIEVLQTEPAGGGFLQHRVLKSYSIP
jgi:hypothetical protein